MSDVLLERIAKALETIAVSKGAAGAPAASTKAADKPAATQAANKPTTAGTGGGKPGTTKAADKSAAAAKPAAAANNGESVKAPGGQHTMGEVRKVIHDVITKEGSKEAVIDILAADGGGAVNLSAVKPEFYDAIYEACMNVINEGGGGGGGEEFDPTA